MSITTEAVTEVRDDLALAAALEAVLFTLNRPVTLLELQEILAMGQSTISTHLAQLKQAGIVFMKATSSR